MSDSRTFSQTQVLFAIGINHRTAPVRLREKAFVHEEEFPALLSVLRETLDEAAVISTCNRTEIYGVTSRPDTNLDFYKDLLIDFKNAGSSLDRNHFFGLVSCAACRQLFSVATSLDSQIVGDTQILGQVRTAYERAKQNRAAGRVINQLFQRSFKLGKLVRQGTGIHRGAVSVSRAAVELVSRRLGSLRERTATVVGAGESSRRSAEALLERNIGRLVIANRTPANAATMADSLGGKRYSEVETIGLEGLVNTIPETDVVISSTNSPDPVVTRSTLANYRKGLMLFDLAIPRDISEDIRELDGVDLRNIDDLRSAVDDNFRRRMNDVPAVNRLVMNEMADFLVWYYSQPLMPEFAAERGRPNRATEQRILKTKEFLLANVGTLHRMALAEGSESFSGHISVVNRLIEMRDEAFAGGL